MFRLYKAIAFFMLLALAAVSVVAAQSPGETETPAAAAPVPLVMLTEYDPWAMVISSDSPTFVLYDSGQAIYWNGEASRYETVTLDEAELAAFLDEIDVSAFERLDEYYDLVMKTDQRTEVIRVRLDNGTDKVVSAYGDLRSDREAIDAAPEVLLNAYDAITRFHREDAAQWEPERYEVMLWEYDTRDANDWPEDWPGLDSPYTVQRDDQYSIFITPEQFAELDAMMQRNPAVELGDQTWAASWRYPFPHEAVWQVMVEQVEAAEE
jgi:hypothetical protein